MSHPTNADPQSAQATAAPQAAHQPATTGDQPLSDNERMQAARRQVPNILTPPLIQAALAPDEAVNLRDVIESLGKATQWPLPRELQDRVFSAINALGSREVNLKTLQEIEAACTAMEGLRLDKGERAKLETITRNLQSAARDADCTQREMAAVLCKIPFTAL